MLPDTIICNNEPITLKVGTPNIATGTIRYDLVSISSGSINGIRPNGDYGLGDLIENLENSSNSGQYVTYTLTPYIQNAKGGLNCNNGIPSAVTIYINPTPMLNISVPDTVYCDSSMVNFTIIDNNGVVYGNKIYDLETQYESAYVEGVIAEGEYGRKDTSNYLINRTNRFRDIRYDFTPRIKDNRTIARYNCALGTDTTITIHLNPTPRISYITLLKGELSDLYCNDSSVTITISSPTEPYPTGDLLYNLIPGYDLNITGVQDTGDYQFNPSGNSSFTNTLHNNHDSDVLDVTYRFDPWIQDTRMIQDCHHGGVDTSITVHVAATLVPTGIPWDTIGGRNIRCFGENNGEIDLGVRGGFGSFRGDYNYLWSTGDGSGLEPTVRDQDDLTAGTYSVVVTDTNGCIGWDTRILTQPDLLRVSWDTIIKNLCSGGYAGSVLIEVEGGTEGYYYTWRRTASTWIKHDSDLINVIEGPYTLNVVDTNGCLIPTELYQVAAADAISLTVSPKEYGSYEISCFGNSDGEIEIEVGSESGHGDLEDWHYIWTQSPDGSQYYDTLAVDTMIINSLRAGYYRLEAWDTANCPYQESYILTEPEPIQFDSVVTAQYGDLINSFNISCRDSSDGSIDLFVSTERAGRTYTYLWDGPPDATLNLTAKAQSNIPDGTYSVDITDNFGCFLDTSFVLVQPDSIQANPTFSDHIGFNIDCNDGSDGSIALHPYGGLGPYTYDWEPVTGGQISTPDQDSIYGLSVGDYEVTVTDYLNCVRNWTFSLDQPPPIQTNEVLSDFNNYNVSCSDTLDGAILSLNASGGVGGYSYLWHRTGDLSWSDTTELPTGLPADIYILEVTDLNNCLYTDSIEFIEPDPLMVDSFMSMEISCNSTNDGWARVIVSGGIEHLPYDYLWNDPLSTITETVTNLGIGWYNVAIADANGCRIIDSVYIAEPLPVTAQFSIISENWYHGEMISCAGFADGAVWVQASGGRQPYIYDWLGTTVSNDTIHGLAAGTHQVRIEDGGGCDTIISVILTEPLALNAIGIIERNASCYNLNDGRINLEPRGGVSPYTYRWSGESLPSDITTEDIDNVYADEYILTLWDMNLCRMDTSFIITEPGELRAEIIVDTIPFCPDSYDGMIHVNVTGGTEPYDIWWISQNTNDPVLYNLGEGAYVVQVDDQFNCGLVGDSVVLISDENNCLEIPTAISPNGDGKNDVWEIPGMEYYPDAIIEIYNRWGDLIFRSERGYNNKFDGTYRGRHLPVDSYHFIIRLNNGGKPILGNVTIIL